MKKIYMAGVGGMLGEAFYKQFKGHYDLKCSDIDVNEDIFIRSHLEYLFDYLPLNKKVLIINYL